MQDINIERSEINIEALDAELRTDLGGVVLGVSSTGENVTVHLADKATQSQQDQARNIVLAHDADRLTPRQQAKREHDQKLGEFRQNYGSATLELAPFDSESPTIRQLAQKIAWLEMEFRASRGEW